MASSSGQGSPGGFGLLSGSRARSYGSLMQSPCSPVRRRRVEHQVAPGDTLQGLALKYGVTMEQIKRANRLYTNDSIFLKQTLHIPVWVDPKQLVNGLYPEEEEMAGVLGDNGAEAAAGESEEGKEEACNPARDPSEGAAQQPDLSATDFLRNLDSKIQLSKSTAVKTLREGDILVTGEAAAGCSVVSSYQRHGTSHAVSPRAHQRSLLGPVPLTITTLAATLKDKEDEIFKL